jgi:hypothetical protein
VLLGGALIGPRIKGGSSKEPSFHFFGTFLEFSHKTFDADICQWVFDQPVNDLYKKEVAGDKLLPPLNRFSIEGLIRYRMILNSTLLFLERPSCVELSAMGLVAP